ncbi:MAG: carboxypeptidase regulatory-like domain-containing protein, partial [Blastocatellia bacterium]
TPLYTGAKTGRFTIGAYTYHVGAGVYSPVPVSVTTLTMNPSSLSISATDDFLPRLVQATAVSRFWSLTETGDLTANLAFTYTDPDINGTETNYKVFRRSGGVTAEVAPSTINAAANTATVNGITDFSDWGIGESLAPQIAFASISGQVTEGINPVGKVNVVLSNAQGIVASTNTNNFGKFRFGNVATGVSYTVSISAKQYVFTPSSQTVLLLDNVSNLNFSGTENRPPPPAARKSVRLKP